MSQVKNLRAMFENKGDTSPERGRSSGASTPVQGTSVVSESPRPLSKVRTNFVAIEKDGRIGLQRDPSHESSVSRRRLSMDTDSESVSTVPDRPSASLEDAPRGNKPFFQEDIPESPRHPIEPPKTPTEQMGAVTDEPSINPDKQIDKEEPSPSLLPAELAPEEPTPEKPASEEPTPEAPAPVSPKKETKEKKPEAVPAAPAATNGKPKANTVKELAPAAIVKAATPKKTTTTRPSAVSTKATSTKPPAKSPSATKPPSSTTHKTETKPTAKTAPAAKKEHRQASAASSTATRPTATTASKKPQPLKPTTSDTGFVKPKPKSPTKPVHLPASLMAPTAASGAKTGRQAQASASSQNLNVPARPGSRASATGTSASAGKTVKRQPSNVGRPRPSLGPPPKKPSEPTHAKKEAPVDESFLARMMRPTQASSSKTAEKVPTTPPKKTTKRSSSSGADPSRREFGVKTPGSAKKQTRRPAESKPSAAGSVASDETPTIEVVPEEQTPGPTKSQSTTEEIKANDAQKDSKKPGQALVAADEGHNEVVEPVQKESQAQEAVKTPIKEKQEAARPIAPQPAREEKPVKVSNITAPEKTETSPQEPPADQPNEPVVESEKPTENSDIVPLVEESSSQPPVVVKETAETSGNELGQETEQEVVPLLEKDPEPALESETTEKQNTEIETASKDNMDDVKATDAAEEKDTTGHQTEEEKN
ncbi:hypothetical protein FPSE_08563 [Fusarium pseudograminearum CS3096]|uniref:Uncharacterized protein n=1 Tax=Fusarium pseudograminearum (strain CS3096) TaxID=1028729 RepID=K3VCH8_FUSPC|nr:hypothetical protein FPSE_08563 [Fusarium pseudograminearum CS3096]EKJ71324.1 hypothetical protein FPSE_08563 [Fusarium pseudograminearum CS3096]KAF0637413.1 hypothetical protein FPSE5266_08563 [Fusarium pseudograminearum]